jgi:glycine oxidase
MIVKNPDCLVIGAGALGLALAHTLAGHGAAVTLLDRGVAGGEASWAGAGILSPLPPWAYPDAVTRLAMAGAALYPALAGELRAATGMDPELLRSGMLVLPEHDAATAAAWCSRHDLAMRAVPARDVLPSCASPARGLWLEDVMQVRNPRLLAALRARLAQQGVRCLEQTTVTGLATDGRRILHVRTPAGELSAANYVVAAGAWSRQLLGEHALAVDIRPVRGQMLLYQARPGQIGAIVLQNGIYVVPRADGHVLVGSTLEDAGFDKSTTDAARRALHAAAIALFPLLADAPLVAHWAGLRPGSPGNVPTIGRHPTLENLYLNSGHFRYGVTMAPASARLLLDIMLDRPPMLDPTPYRWPTSAPPHPHNTICCAPLT